MKNFSFFLFCGIMISFSVKAQNKILDYSFGAVIADTVYDESGNGNDGLLVDGADAYSGIVKLGVDNAGYLNIPPSVLNGLGDFTIRIKARVPDYHTDGIKPMNTIFSGSNSACIYCFGLSGNIVYGGWELTMNGVKHIFPQAGFYMSYAWIEIVRNAGVVSFSFNDILLGTFADTSSFDLSTFIFGQHEQCLGGCFHENKDLNGGLNELRIYDGPFDLKGSVESEELNFSVFPNPVSTTTTISFSLQQTSHTTITLLDMAGRKIKAVLDENLFSGTHNVQLNRDELTAGIYFLQMSTGLGSFTEKIVLLR